MKSINKVVRTNIIDKLIFIFAVIIILYLLCSIYFIYHYFFNTKINGAEVSLKAYKTSDRIIKNYIDQYELTIIERDGKTEIITSKELGLQFKVEVFRANMRSLQNPFLWIFSLFKKQVYQVPDLCFYDTKKLNHRIHQLNCLNRDIIEPRDVSFLYHDGSYEMVDEVYGNKLRKECLFTTIRTSVEFGITKLNLDENLCYERPKFTTASKKAQETLNILNRYVSAKIIYHFGSRKEVLDSSRINNWLIIDNKLDVTINKNSVEKYISELAHNYNTAGKPRNFKASIGKTIEVKGGIYGWKINQHAEVNALLDNIKSGETRNKEPVYSQKAISREENDIGDTYVEINITKQHLWFYKNGKLLVHGPVVTGNPNNGNATVIGTNMINYKENGSTLSGRNYDVRVTYWMPFYGNIGIHDASWRSAFGGEIYKKKGTHGCVNTPKYLAKKIFENIEEGTPVISYEEAQDEE